jgi:hypothetical protein
VRSTDHEAPHYEVCTNTTHNYSETNKNEFKINFLKGKDNMFTKMDNEGLAYTPS